VVQLISARDCLERGDLEDVGRMDARMACSLGIASAGEAVAAVVVLECIVVLDALPHSLYIVSVAPSLHLIVIGDAIEVEYPAFFFCELVDANLTWLTVDSDLSMAESSLFFPESIRNSTADYCR